MTMDGLSHEMLASVVSDIEAERATHDVCRKTLTVGTSRLCEDMGSSAACFGDAFNSALHHSPVAMYVRFTLTLVESHMKNVEASFEDIRACIKVLAEHVPPNEFYKVCIAMLTSVGRRLVVVHEAQRVCRCLHILHRNRAHYIERHGDKRAWVYV